MSKPGNTYLNAEARTLCQKLMRPGQSYSGVIIEHLSPIAEKHDKE